MIDPPIDDRRQCPNCHGTGDCLVHKGGDVEEEADNLRIRNEELEVDNARLRDLIDKACNALTDSICVSGNDRQTNLHWVRKLEREAATAPPDSEPAEGEGDDDDLHEDPHHEKGDPTVRKSFHGGYVWTYCDECGPDVKVDEDGLCIACGKDAVYFGKEPDDTAEQQDAMLERRGALEVFERLCNWYDIPGDDDDVRNPDSARADVEIVHQALSRTSDEGTGCVVPEAIRRLPKQWRERANHAGHNQGGGKIRECANELDRAIAEQGGQRVPEGWELVPVEPTPRMVEAFYRAYERPLSPVRWESPFSNAWEALLAAAPQPEHGESDEL